jgi:hypothetical protein
MEAALLDRSLGWTTAALPRSCPLWTEDRPERFPIRFSSTNEHPEDEAPDLTTLLPNSVCDARPEIGFRTGLSGDTDPTAEGASIRRQTTALVEMWPRSPTTS